MTLRRGMDLGEKSHECSCADMFVSGYVFVLTKALKTLLDLFVFFVLFGSDRARHPALPVRLVGDTFSAAEAGGGRAFAPASHRPVLP